MNEPTSPDRPSYRLLNKRAFPPELVKEKKDYLDSHIRSKQEQAEKSSEEMPESLVVFAEELFEFIEQSEKTWGVEEYVPEVLVHIKNEPLNHNVVTLNQDEKDVGGADVLSRILYLSNEPTGYENKPVNLKEAVQRVRDIALSKVLAHEMHHLLAQRNFSLYENDSHRLDFQPERDGLGYFHKGKEGNAVEEGLSVLFSNWATEKALNSDENNVAREMIKLSIEHFKKSGQIEEGVPEESLRVDVTNGQMSVGLDYPKSVSLVKFLEEKVDNFVSLAQQARIDQKTLALARAIEDAFGPVSPTERAAGESPYHLIMMSREETAEDTLNKLKERLKTKSS
jgi:hypothetical protein